MRKNQQKTRRKSQDLFDAVTMYYLIMANLWGNPELKSFKNNFIRRVIVDTARVFVHKQIVVETEELLIRAADNGAVFSDSQLPAILPSYAFDDSEEAAYGLKFRIPNFSKIIDVSDLGFIQDGDTFIYENFDLENKAETIALPSYIDEVSDKIGSRQLKLGSKGKDVKFLAYFLGLDSPSQRDVFDDDFTAGVAYFQTRMGMPQTGEMDWYTWRGIIPKGSERVAAGYAGAKVRALQSALIVNGYNPPTNSRFGTETIRAVREFQVDKNFRVTGRCGFLEWNELFLLK